MHPSTIAAILAFTAGMTVSGAPTAEPIQKREAQRGHGRRIGNVAEGIGGGIGFIADGITIGQFVQGKNVKREARKGRAGRVGDVAEGIVGGIGAVSDVLTIHQAVQGQNAKREARKGRAGRVGDVAEGIADGIGAISDGITIGQLVQGQNVKRDARKGRAGRAGDVAEGIAGGIGAVSDLFTIHQAVQGQNAKREARKGRAGRAGDVAEGIADGIGAISDGITIGQIFQGQNAKREARKGRAGRAGDVAEGIADGIGAISDGITIGQIFQGQNAKREARKGRAGRAGDVAEGIADGIGAISDGITIGQLVQGQNAKREVRKGRAGRLSDIREPPEASFPVIDPSQFQKRDPQRPGRAGQVFGDFPSITYTGTPEDMIDIANRQKEKRDPQSGGRITRAGDDIRFSRDGSARTLPAIDHDFTIHGQKEKRDPEPHGRGGRLSNFVDGFTDGIGAFNDAMYIHDTLQGQNAKRDISTINDLVNYNKIHYDFPPLHHEKRDPQRRGRLGRLGNFVDGVTDGIGAFNDAMYIHDTIQGSQPAKRDAMAHIGPLSAAELKFESRPDSVMIGVPHEHYVEKRDAKIDRETGHIALPDGHPLKGYFSDVTGSTGELHHGLTAKRNVQRIDTAIDTTFDNSHSANAIEHALRGSRPTKGHAIYEAGNVKRDGVHHFDTADYTLGLDSENPSPAFEKRDPQRHSLSDIGFIGGSVGDQLLWELKNGKKSGTVNVKRDGVNRFATGEDYTLGLDSEDLSPEFEKRDPQRRGRLGQLGSVAEGFAGAIGVISDGFTIHGAIKGQ
ncbi:hypothetical protein ACJQWK_00788 [Exserohilum turcicum]|uniref:Uncharacterized protein n=1 Tax=Exserohilum turcicum (strain 28A) TaxID=671987 RepID=R0K7K5_EXST2|nr:uncharacterized protein SETTUDRAFT_33267 [Exserohilum turcica Et28A]EOA84272.1 hypothetical protein SETTUDRAFT_33267 [Exserohilum turcica Et28A]